MRAPCLRRGQTFQVFPEQADTCARCRTGNVLRLSPSLLLVYMRESRCYVYTQHVTRFPVRPTSGLDKVLHLYRRAQSPPVARCRSRPPWQPHAADRPRSRRANSASC